MRKRSSSFCSLLPLDFLKVELKLFAFKDVAVAASRLAGARRDACEELARSELVEHFLIKILGLLVLLNLLFQQLQL